MPLPRMFFDDNDVVRAFPEYELAIPFLGRGGFKVAYHASAGDGERVVKILTDPLDAETDQDGFVSGELPERLARELAAMAQVVSPHVVQILSEPRRIQLGEQYEFITYEEPYYSGGTLEDRIALTPLDAETAQQLVIALLSAVQDLWEQRQIVHRDIKPGNIVFDAEDRPVLLDLGIALYTGMPTLTDSLAESPRTLIYAAPEQFEPRRYAQIDFRTDLFQIGIVGFKAVSGVHPFVPSGSPTVDRYMATLLGDSPIDLSILNCSPELREVLGRLLARRPSRRYRTITEPLSKLREAL
ncbi:MAG: serine/threonine-protein kinase [Rhodoglobus sp.]